MMKTILLHKLNYVRRYLFDNSPKDAYIELTNHCNVKCVMCPHQNMTREKGFMSFEVLKKAVEEIKRFKTIKRVNLHYYGEPFLNKDIFKFIDYIRSNTSGIAIALDTNGILLNKDISREILSKVDDITFSIHGPDRESYKTIYGLDMYDKVLKNLDDLMEIKRSMKSKAHISVQITRMDMTNAKVDTFLKNIHHDDVSVSVTFCSNAAGCSKEDHRLIKEDFRRKIPCYELLGRVVIMWNGDVTVCCADFNGSFKMGNIIEANLKHIWNSKKHRNMQRQHLFGRFGKYKLCARCEDDIWYKHMKEHEFGKTGYLK